MTGIIPARAGFTGMQPVIQAVVEDHPRSRGVYPGKSTGIVIGDGSSPLARGLPKPFFDAGKAGGIIPARAGFTLQPSHSTRTKQDHPRSRGVYQNNRRPGHKIPGSSPLARGLRHGQSRPVGDAGIIPARAGFTTTRCAPPWMPGDHPRSRGVYVDSRPHGFCAVGSSPLARGLPVPVRGGPIHGRIIPARAGFTAFCERVDFVRTDHPRSRGVYGSVLTGGDGVAGSSPLARGLLPCRGEVQGGDGIIPARAGFT